MADKIEGYNTLQKLIFELLRREKNSLEILEILSLVYRSDAESLLINYIDSNNIAQSYEIPSYNFLISEIKRLDSNQKSMAGLNDRPAMIQQADGSTQIIFNYGVPREPDLITSIPTPQVFRTKDNDVYNLLYDPILYTRIDASAIMDSDIMKVKIKRLILDLDDTTKLDFFNNVIDGNTFEYEQILSDFTDHDIKYEDTEFILDVSPRLPRKKGYFNVINSRVIDDYIVRIDNTNVITKKIVYKLNQIIYTNTEDGSTLSLKNADKLVLNDGHYNTIYQIDTIDAGTGEVVLNRIEGYGTLSPGTDVLYVYPDGVTEQYLDIPVSKDQYTVLFFKPISKDYNIQNLEWGYGTGFYTNNLIQYDGQETLLTFFDSSVGDLKSGIKQITEERTIPISMAITPNTPVVASTDFRVEKINIHKEDTESLIETRKLLSSKDGLKSEITNLESIITGEKQSLLNDILTDDEKEVKKKKIQDLYDKKQNLTSEYSSVIDQILAKTKDISESTPKYRARGFFPIPEPKYTDEANRIGEQQVIQFEYQYRYLNKNNVSSNTNEFKYGDDLKGTFSRWEGVKTQIREKTYNPDTGVIEWKEQITNDPDAININQVDIPISSNENVELRIRSISEAGYPYNVKYSEWSESIIIEFPEELSDTADQILEQISIENSRMAFQEELNALGLIEHVEDSVIIGERNFKHSGDSIYSNFTTPENKPIPVNDKLEDHDSSINELKAVILGSTAEIAVSIVDESGNKISDVSRNNTINVFAGYYKDIVGDDKKGEIISKLYYIQVENISDVDLQLLSYIPGSYEDPLPIVSPPTDPYYEDYIGYLISRDEYAQYRKQWRSPLSLRGITQNTDFINHHLNYGAKYKYPFREIPSIQSAQVKGQIIYSRERDLTLGTLLYDNPSVVTDQAFLPLPLESGASAESFVWNGSETIGSVNGGGYLTKFCAHVNHPDLIAGSDYMSKFDDYQNYAYVYPTLPKYTIETSSGYMYYPVFYHSAYFNLQATETNGIKQLSFQPYTPKSVGSFANLSNFPRKLGFKTTDKYLIGRNTCGSYLFLAPQFHKDLYNGSVIYNEAMIVKKGSSYKILIPFMFQFRMTDYHGIGDTGNGIIGGYGSSSALNLLYEKKLGFDIAIKNQDLFSFDVKVEAQYKKLNT